MRCINDDFDDNAVLQITMPFPSPPLFCCLTDRQKRWQKRWRWKRHRYLQDGVIIKVIDRFCLSVKQQMGQALKAKPKLTIIFGGNDAFDPGSGALSAGSG
jgi:hypothetical protein